MNFIKKVVDGRIDESIHLQFQKFSKGEFGNRAVIKAKRSGKKITITTTAEFANEMVRDVAEMLGHDATMVKGIVVSTADLTGELDFVRKKQFMGVKQYVIEKEMSGLDILELLDKFPAMFFGLSFEVGGTKLKIKTKAPKSAKPKTKDSTETPNPDFCKLITEDKVFGESFVFEKPDFKDALIAHTFFVNEIIAPEGEKDFAKIRALAKRKGVIVREGEIDGQKVRQEIGFEA